jgi:hypothetical protein
VEIKFSRHAKRRAQLYKISETVVIELIKNETLVNGKNIIIKKIDAFKYPLKIVIEVEKEIIVITNYPLKKGKE